jgi:hypothetical protein
MKSLSGFLPLRQLSCVYLCCDWVYWYTIQSVNNNFKKNQTFYLRQCSKGYSMPRCPSLLGIGKPPWQLWLNRCSKFTARLRDLTDNCICRVQRGGSHSKFMLNSIIAHRISPCNVLCDLFNTFLLLLNLYRMMWLNTFPGLDQHYSEVVFTLP